MATVADILACVQNFAPEYMKEDWDHVGLNCGHANRTVTKVLVALDPFMDVCQEAVRIGAQLIVTHHALIWTPGFVTDSDEQGRCTLYLIENNIACINAHTNLDCAPGGVNDILAEKLGLTAITVVAPKGHDEYGRDYGLMRCGITAECSLNNFLKRVKKSLGCEGLRFVDAGKSVQKVAVVGGAGGSELAQAVAAGCDTFVTADIKYNQFWEAKNLGINLIDAGHFHTENPVCEYIAQKIRADFPEIEVQISQVHTDCANFFQ